jgi:hypothetical protein
MTVPGHLRINGGMQQPKLQQAASVQKVLDKIRAKYSDAHAY